MRAYEAAAAKFAEIHKLQSAGELLERATGSPLRATALIGHFQERYRPDPVS